MEQGVNAALYWENTNWVDTVCLIPTSARSGEGIPDLIATIVKLAQDQMFRRLSLSDELECTVLEVKKIEGLGTTVDVCLVNGILRDTDLVVLATTNGPLVTPLRRYVFLLSSM
jgi:translation initiation factor 5B